MALSTVNHHMYWLALLDKQFNSIGQLQLTALARANLAQRLEDFTVQHITAGGYQRRGRFLRLGLFHHANDALDICIGSILHIKNAVVKGLFPRHFKCTQHASAPLPANGDHLF